MFSRLEIDVENLGYKNDFPNSARIFSILFGKCVHYDSIHYTILIKFERFNMCYWVKCSNSILFSCVYCVSFIVRVILSRCP